MKTGNKQYHCKNRWTHPTFTTVTTNAVLMMTILLVPRKLGCHPFEDGHS